MGGHLDTFILCVYNGSREFHSTWSFGRGWLNSISCSVSSCQVSLFNVRVLSPPAPLSLCYPTVCPMVTLVTGCMVCTYGSSLDLRASCRHSSLHQCRVCCLSAVVGSAAFVEDCRPGSFPACHGRLPASVLENGSVFCFWVQVQRASETKVC